MLLTAESVHKCLLPKSHCKMDKVKIAVVAKGENKHQMMSLMTTLYLVLVKEGIFEILCISGMLSQPVTVHRCNLFPLLTSGEF